MGGLAIIPARSGSRGLPDKNVLDLCGRPMLAYTVDAALDSGCFDRVVVSTDSERYGRMAEGLGAEYMPRAAELASGNTPTLAVVRDVLERVGTELGTFALLQPTSPMRHAGHVREAVDLFEANSDRFDFVVSVKLSEHSSDLVRPLGMDGSLAAFSADFSNYKRQVCEPDYSPNGAIFIGKPSAYLVRGHFFGERSLAYVMGKEDSIDVDDEIDFSLAQARMALRLGRRA